MNTMSHTILSRLKMIVPILIFALYGCAVDVTQTTSTYQYVIPEELIDVPRISPEKVKNSIDSGEPILIVDVRESAHFETQHIVGAISIPLWQVIVRTGEFPSDRQIVFY